MLCTAPYLHETSQVPTDDHQVPPHMAAIAAVAAASAAFTTLQFSKPKFILTSSTHRHIRTLISASLSPASSSTTTEFNITFAPPKPKPKPRLKPQLEPSQTLTSSSEDDTTGESGEEFYIPWIVRDENGNLTLQTTPPARLLQAMANANTGKKKKEKDAKAKHSTPTAAPKLSKAARRFYNENFRDSPEQRLSKVLAAAGVASRRSSEELIFGGKVTVNGSVCTTPQTKVDPRRDMIYVNGNRLSKKLPPKVYFALNKPKGYICSCGEEEKKSVLSLFEDYMKSWDKRNPGLPKPRLFTVGRLDVATSGLIIVTNDGEFAQKLTHPSSSVSKEYIATIDGSISKSQLIAIGEGTVVEGVRCVPDAVELLPQQPDISRPRVKVVVHDGRNHEVREIVKNAGLQIYALKRVRIGGFRLPSDLGIGQHIELKTANLRALGWKP